MQVGKYARRTSDSCEFHGLVECPVQYPLVVVSSSEHRSPLPSRQWRRHANLCVVSRARDIVEYSGRIPGIEAMGIRFFIAHRLPVRRGGDLFKIWKNRLVLAPYPEASKTKPPESR